MATSHTRSNITGVWGDLSHHTHMGGHLKNELETPPTTSHNHSFIDSSHFFIHSSTAEEGKIDFNGV
jgi:hypothetical protein